jgi:hypothetical protein
MNPHHLDGSADGEQGMALLKENNETISAETEAKEGRDVARQEKVTEVISDGRDLRRGVEERVESGEPKCSSP